ncbi:MULTISPECIES: hypothetical protein [Streptomycetaceae]|uniref:DUF1508 domain-containing protein n=1 Tax=Streptantibioticus cattleyicolor (strain ATCC 35852 / DSM 46488 / JCM 4925 / NBRC 14057 / NRRL 8057) TaxID=1003195 RepID=F8JW36_STREN|nr:MULTISPECIES: hypothetical protein [Streptomycetaceae]AEW93204.1 hypothetical protein SCATT_08330 [Streptantibioticus cattleyicolor NRRL 8057 = DSM 46488]MYS57928.1 hypothetical protein [Streptomyces sp. SID5468]CCB73567.1 protein of unknown function [Streptantibioticus cattleyicolor NRRL 8057 = DSM 46488]
MSRRRYLEYEARHCDKRGWYVVGTDGHLANIDTGDGRARAAFFGSEEEAEACVRALNGTEA